LRANQIKKFEFQIFGIHLEFKWNSNVGIHLEIFILAPNVPRANSLFQNQFLIMTDTNQVDSDAVTSAGIFVRDNTIGFTFCSAEQCFAFSNIRTTRESGIQRAMEQLQGEQWNEDYSLIAIEKVPEDAAARADYPTPLSEFADMTEDEVIPMICFTFTLKSRFAHFFASFIYMYKNLL